MDNLQMNRNPTLYHILILSFLQLSFVFDLSCAFSPVDNYLIDCGSVAATTVDVDNRKFVGDSSKSGSLLLSASRTVSLRNGNPPRDSSPLYHSARVFTEPSSYEFDIRTKGTHLVRLHFLPFSSSSRYNLSDALFHVSSNGFVLLSDFTVLDRGNPVLKEYLTWVDGEKLVITFTPLRGFPLAFVNAIEVISAPEDLIADTASYITSDGRIEKFSGLTKQALETVYRINVGGPKVTPFNDTLWRTWVPDDEFLKSSGSSKVFYFSGRIRYHRGGASREVAPDNVYNSARAVINQKASMPDSNISWDFPVSSDYKYLVRMHFCDIASISLNLLNFNVYINGYLAYKDLDLSYLTSQMLAAPFYADFIVDGHCSGVISLSIGPSDGSMPERINAILNGVEIMKMNNSVGSLAGEVSLNLLLKSSPKRSIGFLVPAVAVLSLFISALALILKRRTEVKGSVAWSPLPIDVSEGNIKSTNKLGFF